MSPALLLTLVQIHDLAVKHGFEDPDTAAAVAWAESVGNPAASLIVTQAQADAYNAAHPTGPRHGPERSFGLWQVNALVWTRFDETQLTDPDYCAEAALLISRGGTHWQPWSTYNSGLYRRFMPSERPTLPDLAPNASALLDPDDEGPDTAA